MNTPISYTPHPQHWLKDVQFALGVVVALGGAVVIVAHVVQRLAGG